MHNTYTKYLVNRATPISPSTDSQYGIRNRETSGRDRLPIYCAPAAGPQNALSDQIGTLMSIVLPVLTGIGSRGFVEFSSPFKSNGTQHLSWSGGPGVHNDGPQRGRAHRRSQLRRSQHGAWHGGPDPVRSHPLLSHALAGPPPPLRGLSIARLSQARSGQGMGGRGRVPHAGALRRAAHGSVLPPR